MNTPNSTGTTNRGPQAATSLRSRRTSTGPSTSGTTSNRTSGAAAGRSRSRSRSRDVVPSRQRGGVSRRRETDNAGFAEFLHKLVKVLLLPITIPSRISYNLLTSPTTISTTIKLALFTFLLVLSAGFTAVALAGFWYAGVGRAGGVVDVEGWFVYGSKTSPTPHAYIPLSHPEKTFAQGVGYDVDVTMELVRPRRVDAEEGGNFMLGLDFYSQATGAVVTSVSQPITTPAPGHQTPANTDDVYLPCDNPQQCLPAQPYTPASIPSRIINTFTAPAIYFLRLPFTLSPTSLIFNPLRLLRSSNTSGRNKRRKVKSGKDTFVLRRPVISSFGQNAYATSAGEGGRETFEGKGLVMRPDGSGRGKAGTIGAVQVTVGREDGMGVGKGEVKTTGWVVVTFTPRPTGLRYIFASHPMIPLLVVPPIAFFMALSSATFGYFIFSLFFSSARPAQAKPRPKSIDARQPRTTVGESERQVAGGLVVDEPLARPETSQPTSKDGAVHTPARTSSIVQPLNGSTPQGTQTQHLELERGTTREENVSSATGTTSGSSVTSSTAGEDSSESGTITH
ncbi:hypothetical protein QFC21_005688 [Naganishia friedmannii]|uniref:Uncharacterized protein n=1 Tax=Naganishia friedmannii TaxID=89922 RepID=A0ACC2V8L7_9TREE|nr:hypothetical protein QFC21_005688 [Naganishia friedmannii]